VVDKPWGTFAKFRQTRLSIHHYKSTKDTKNQISQTFTIFHKKEEKYNTLKMRVARATKLKCLCSDDLTNLEPELFLKF